MNRIIYLSLATITILQSAEELNDISITKRELLQR